MMRLTAIRDEITATLAQMEALGLPKVDNVILDRKRFRGVVARSRMRRGRTMIEINLRGIGGVLSRWLRFKPPYFVGSVLPISHVAYMTLHEYGHIISLLLIRDGFVWDPVFTWDKSPISRYAMRHHSEAWAEAWAAYHGGRPDLLDTPTKDLIVRAMVALQNHKPVRAEDNNAG